MTLAASVTYAQASPAQRARLEALRDQVLSVAADLSVPVEETLKWGQPAFVPPKSQGTTLRLATQGAGVAAFVHCQTTLVETWRAWFPTEFAYEGNRAVLIPASEPYSQAAFQQMAVMALTYHKAKR